MLVTLICSRMKAHIAVGHGGRTRMIKELNRKYKNVTVESIVTYLRLCEP